MEAGAQENERRKRNELRAQKRSPVWQGRAEKAEGTGVKESKAFNNTR